MTAYLSQFLLVAGIHWLAVMSPGPDFALVLRNSIAHTRRTGLWTALGLGLGILVHVTYAIAGLALVISRSIVLFSIIKLLGATYLIYIGYKSLKRRPAPADDATGDVRQTDKHSDLPALQAIRTGFLTNVLNPKATLFFLALFTQVISPDTPLGLKVLYGTEMSIATFVWFALVATLLTQKPIRALFYKVERRLEQALGAVLIGLGLVIAAESHR